LNFRISTSYFLRMLTSLVKGNTYARDADSRILLEFVSANPTGPLNIVSARAAAYGDALANLLTTLGYQVDREFYVNDYGNQVLLLGASLYLRILEIQGSTIQFQEEEDGRGLEELLQAKTLPKEGYRGTYLVSIAKQALKDTEIQKLLLAEPGTDSFPDCLDRLSRFAVEQNLTLQQQDLQNFGVRFDRFFSERSLHESNLVLSVLDKIPSRDKSTENGKVVFLATHYGDDKDRVVVREDGRPTYLLADIAYHFQKFQRGYARCIDIWGPDHYGYIARLQGALQSLGIPRENFQVLIAQQVNLLENKQKVKMSKRLGVFQTMSDLLEYLGESSRDVGRYFFLMRSSDTPLDFDLELAKDASDKNPVFYLQYAHARIASLFREAGSHPSDEFSIRPEVLEATEDRISLLFWVARFSEEVYDSAKSLEPHRLTNYLQNLSRAFTRFYGNKENRIKDKTGGERETLLGLCQATKLCLVLGLGLLGISAPEVMKKEKE